MCVHVYSPAPAKNLNPDLDLDLWTLKRGGPERTGEMHILVLPMSHEQGQTVVARQLM